MSKKHDKILSSLYSNKMSGNIHWKEVESLLLHLGADLTETRGATVTVKINGQFFTLHRPHHGSTMNKNELHHLRDFLTAAGLHD